MEPSVTPWNAERQAVEFGVEIGEYRGAVRVPRRVIQGLLPEPPTPEGCLQALLPPTDPSRAAPRGSAEGQVTEDGNVEISG